MLCNETHNTKVVKEDGLSAMSVHVATVNTVHLTIMQFALAKCNIVFMAT